MIRHANQDFMEMTVLRSAIACTMVHVNRKQVNALAPQGGGESLVNYHANLEHLVLAANRFASNAVEV